MTTPLTDALIKEMRPIGLLFKKTKSRKPSKKTLARRWSKRMSTLRVNKRSRGGRKSNLTVFKTVLKLPKEKTRSQLIKILDGLVSNYVLVKVCRGKCRRCGKQHEQYENSKGQKKWHNYGCSHYWPRDYMGTRFEIDNLDGLCWLPCHSQKWEHDKQGAYKDYMIKKLGQAGFNRLEVKARGITKFSTQDIKLMIDNFDKIWK